METKQIAGMLATIATVILVDLPLDRLVPLAMFLGGVAIFFVSWLEHKRH